LLGMTTKGDKILDVTLSKIGGKGLFVKELEAAMLKKEADLAVHSLKDVPMELQDEFALSAVLEREDPRDAFVSNKYASLDEMPAGAKVGTASLRRELMVRANYPHLEVLPIRGNVGTRLSKLDRGDFDALVMACAGLKRLEKPERIKSVIPIEISVPSPGQGAIGIETRSNDPEAKELVACLNDETTRLCTRAERNVSRALGGSCQVPLAAFATIDGEEMNLRTLVGNHKTGEFITANVTGKANDPDGTSAKAVAILKEKGAERILKEVLAASNA
ncbi:MAG: hydroxymethylbilane synthase, partial [Burkholderiales bacterium]|nr:hydroxymethylbilane synthase [Burkholderiales bacterium]